MWTHNRGGVPTVQDLRELLSRLCSVCCEPHADAHQAQGLASVKPRPTEIDSAQGLVTEMDSAQGLVSHFIYTYLSSDTLLNRESPWGNVTFHPEVKCRGQYCVQ